MIKWNIKKKTMKIRNKNQKKNIIIMTIFKIISEFDKQINVHKNIMYWWSLQFQIVKQSW